MRILLTSYCDVEPLWVYILGREVSINCSTKHVLAVPNVNARATTRAFRVGRPGSAAEKAKIHVPLPTSDTITELAFRF